MKRNNNLSYALLLTILFLSISLKKGYSQTGPAGVGSSSTNTHWLDASQLTGFTDGQTFQHGLINQVTGTMYQPVVLLVICPMASMDYQ